MDGLEENNKNAQVNLRNILLEYLVTFLLEGNSDITDMTDAYFASLRQVTKTSTVKPPKLTMSSMEMFDFPKWFLSRRKSIVTESMDPEKSGDLDIKTVPKTNEQRQKLANSLASIKIFHTLDQGELTQMVEAMVKLPVVPGEVVMRQGDEGGDQFFVVDKGHFEESVSSPTGMFCVARTHIDKGFFGELALISSEPRGSTVTALTNGSLWVLDRVTFRKIVLRSAYLKGKLYKPY